MIKMKMMDYWLVMHVLERSEVCFVEGRKYYIYFGSGLLGVAFAERFVSWRKRWEVIVVVGNHIRRMMFSFVVVGYWVSFVEWILLLFVTWLFGMMQSVDWSFQRSLFDHSCSATSSLKVVSISFLKSLLFIYSIFRKLLCEKEEAMVDSSLDRDIVALVLVDSRLLVFVEGIPFLFSIVGK